MMRSTSVVLVVSLLMVVSTAATAQPGAAPAGTAAAVDPAELAAVAALLEQHGAAKLADWIRERRHGKLTIQVGHQLKAAVGPPNLKLVTAASVLHDLHLTGVTVADCAAELARRGEASSAPLVIAQKDVGPPGGARPSAAGGPGRASGGPSGGGDGACPTIVPARAVELAAQRGCDDATVTSVTVGEPQSSGAHPVYTVRGSCYLTAELRTRPFEAGVKCGVKQLAGQLQVEGSQQPVTQATESSPVWFKLLDS